MAKQTKRSFSINTPSAEQLTGNPHLTAKQRKRSARNESIRFDYNTQIKIHGSTTMGVVAYLSRKYKVSEATIFRCVK